MPSRKTILELCAVTHHKDWSGYGRFHSIQGNATNETNLETRCEGFTQRDIDSIFNDKETMKLFKQTSDHNGTYYALRQPKDKYRFWFLAPDFTPKAWRRKSRKSFIGFGDRKHFNGDIYKTNPDIKNLFFTEDEEVLKHDYDPTAAGTHVRKTGNTNLTSSLGGRTHKRKSRNEDDDNDQKRVGETKNDSPSVTASSSSSSSSTDVHHRTRSSQVSSKEREKIVQSIHDVMAATSRSMELVEDGTSKSTTAMLRFYQHSLNELEVKLLRMGQCIQNNGCGTRNDLNKKYKICYNCERRAAWDVPLDEPIPVGNKTNDRNIDHLTRKALAKQRREQLARKLSKFTTKQKNIINSDSLSIRNICTNVDGDPHYYIVILMALSRMLGFTIHDEQGRLVYGTSMFELYHIYIHILSYYFTDN